MCAEHQISQNPVMYPHALPLSRYDYSGRPRMHCQLACHIIQNQTMLGGELRCQNELPASHEVVTFFDRVPCQRKEGT